MSSLVISTSASLAEKARYPALKNISNTIQSLEKAGQENADIVKNYLTSYVKYYPNILRGTFLTQDGLYAIFRQAASPFIGEYQTFNQLVKDI
jgi:hypothetical protein